MFNIHDWPDATCGATCIKKLLFVSDQIPNKIDDRNENYGYWILWNKYDIYIIWYIMLIT